MCGSDARSEAALWHEALLVGLAKLEQAFREQARIARSGAELELRAKRWVREAYYAGRADAFYDAAQRCSRTYETVEKGGAAPGQ